MTETNSKMGTGLFARLEGQLPSIVAGPLRLVHKLTERLRVRRRAATSRPQIVMRLNFARPSHYARLKLDRFSRIRGAIAAPAFIRNGLK